jgi:uncharacterized membrane protein
MSHNAKVFFTTEQQEAIKQAIVSAEHNTSGEIRVHLEDKCTIEAMQRAIKVFSRLKMHKTKGRNAVLFYLAVLDKKFAIVGDTGIHKAVPEDFWDNIKLHMQQQFKEGKFTEGLCEAIEKAGLQLKEHFPHKRDDVNELNDEVSFG